jgi:hypothetical protein
LHSDHYCQFIFMSRKGQGPGQKWLSIGRGVRRTRATGAPGPTGPTGPTEGVFLAWNLPPYQ